MAEAASPHHPPGLDPFGPGSPTTLVDRLRAHGAVSPASPVLHPGTTGPGGWWTAGRLAEEVEAAGAVFGRLGVGPGDRVLWSAAPSLPAVVACLGALAAGAVVVPLNPAYRRPEVAHVVGDVRPVAAVVDRPDIAAAVTGALPSPPALLDPGLVPLGPVPAGDPAAAPPAPTGADPALIVYTSGTTGRPKGAVLSHANLAAGVDAVARAWDWCPDDRLVLALPLFHVHGLCAALFGTLGVGASAVLVAPFDAGEVAAAAGSATMFFGVPTMYHRLAAHGARPLARLRLCVSGSAPLAPALWHGLRREAGVDVLERYGMTETLLTVSNPLVGERRPGTVGFPLPGVSVRLAPGGPGDEGAGAELWVRGPSVFAGYWERPAATEAAFTAGWFATGDAAAVDADGYLSILGRRSDLILSGGFNVYPAEVEDVLMAHPGVAEVAVVGVASDEWGEEVTAFVVPAQGTLDAAGLAAWAAERLAPYKRPRAYHAVDALPRNAMGKVLRGQLAGPG